MEIALWIAQVLLGVGFLGVGFSHAFRFEQVAVNPRTSWARHVGRSNLRVIGLLEIAGAIGVIVPAVTGFVPWLASLAAVGLVLLMLAAAVFHVRRGEKAAIAPNAVLGVIAAFVAWGRYVAT